MHSLFPNMTVCVLIKMQLCDHSLAAYSEFCVESFQVGCKLLLSKKYLLGNQA